MIISLNWLKQYTKIDMPVDELAVLIGARLVEIEEVIDLGKKYQGIIVAKVVSVEKHSGADKLNVCMVDDGGKTKGINRDSKGLVQVVCGAPNVREDMMVAWLPPGTTVPTSFDDDEPFVLGKRELRGVVSNGMLASAKELAIGDSHEGILEIDIAVKPGSSFASTYELDDYLLDIENKSLTHRPDCFGVIGFAREVAAITNKQFKTPSWLLDTNASIKRSPSAASPLKVSIKNPELSPRYQAVVLSGADQVLQSPVQIQTWLARVGMKPISAIVDVTNYLMTITGQPLHAFDYDKFVNLNNGKAEIVVRAGKNPPAGGEKLKLLDGREIKLTDQDIVIASGETPVALAGAMGGSLTAIDKDTKNILLESASFNLYNLRGTQMRHGIFTDAITRFTKGQSPEQTAPVLSQATGMLQDLTGAQVASAVIEQYPGKQKEVSVNLSLDSVDQVLGAKFSKNTIVSTLEHAEFDLTEKTDNLRVNVPYWRADIHIAEEIIEEIGRINGYDEIKPSLPKRSFTAADKSELETLKQKLRQILLRAGANDVLSYSFVHGDLLKATGQKTTDSFAITNAISPRLQYYRQTLIPSLLEIVHPNIKAGSDEFLLYEINKTHNKVHGKEKSLPEELEMIALVYANKKSINYAPYYKIRRQLDFIAEQLGLVFEYSVIDKKPEYPVTAPFDYKRSAYITEKNSGTFIGIIGEYRKQVVKNLKLPQTVAGCEIGTEDLLKAAQAPNVRYKPLSRYPSTTQDVTFQVSEGVSYAQVFKSVEDALTKIELDWSLEPLGVYQPVKTNETTKNISFRIMLTDPTKTITKDIASKATSDVVSTVSTQLKAKLI